MRLRLRIATALALLVALAAPGAALASGGDVVRDCTDDGSLSKSYSQAEYADALAHLPTDVDEYSDCRSVIRRAQLGGGSGSSGGAGGSGGGLGGGFGSSSGGGGDDGTGGPAVDPLAGATAEERASYEKAVVAGNAPVVLDGRPVRPGALGGTVVNDVSDLPTPLLAAIALLVLLSMFAAGFGTHRLVVGRRTA